MASAVKGEDGVVCVAQITGASGVRGELRLRAFTAEPEGIVAYGPVCDGAGRELFRLTLIRVAKAGIVARAEGIADRDAAEALRGMMLYVPRRRLPAPDEDEFYHTDLIGLEAVDISGRPCGRVVAVHNHGAGDLVEIADDDGPALLVPFTREAVPEIDLAQRRITVDPPTVG